MAHENNTNCKICTSPYRMEVEKYRSQDRLTFADIEQKLKDKYGFHVSSAAIHRHMKNHFDFTGDAMEVVLRDSRNMFKENLLDSGNRAAKLSGMIHASYEYIVEHYDEMDMRSALQMLFASIDQLNKMEGTGAFAGTEFMMKFQEMLNAIKKDTTIQPTLVFKADELGQSTPAEPKTDTLPEK